MLVALDADDVVDDGRHRAPLGLGVAVREGDGDLFVRGEHQVGSSRPHSSPGNLSPRNVAPGLMPTVMPTARRNRRPDRTLARRLARRRRRGLALRTLPESESLTAELLGRRIPGERRVV